MAEVELCELEVAGLGDLEVARGAKDYGDGMACALDYGGFVGSSEAVRCGLVKGAAEEAVAEALRSLGVDDVLARDGGGDKRAVGGAVDLLDGVDGGEADDGCTVLGDGIDGAVDCVGVDEWADGVVDEDDVVGLGSESGEAVGDGLLAVFASGCDANAGGEAVFVEESLDVFDLRGLDCEDELTDTRDGEEGAQGVDDDGLAGEQEVLLWLV